MSASLALCGFISLPYTANASIEFDGINNFGDFDNADASIIVGGMSYHFDKNNHKYLNETNPSIGVELWDISVVYVHENSWNDESFYITYSPELWTSDILTLSGHFGAATGYHKGQYVVREDGGRHTNVMPTFLGLTPLVGLTGKLHITDNSSIDLSVTPVVAMLSTSFYF